MAVYISKPKSKPLRISLVTQMVKRLLTMWETRVRSLGWEDPLEKEIATHSSTLAWKIPWTEEPGSLQSMGSQRVGHDWVTKLCTLRLWNQNAKENQSHTAIKALNHSPSVVYFLLPLFFFFVCLSPAAACWVFLTTLGLVLPYLHKLAQTLHNSKCISVYHVTVIILIFYVYLVFKFFIL